MPDWRCFAPVSYRGASHRPGLVGSRFCRRHGAFPLVLLAVSIGIDACFRNCLAQVSCELSKRVSIPQRRHRPPESPHRNFPVVSTHCASTLQIMASSRAAPVSPRTRVSSGSPRIRTTSQSMAISRQGQILRFHAKKPIPPKRGFLLV